MNWYKRIKLSVEGLKPSYLQIGHINEGVLWAVNNQLEFHSRKLDHPFEIHDDKMESEFPGPWLAWGRYEPKRHIVSLSLAPQDPLSILRQRMVTDKVTDMLKRTFDNPTIFIYDD